MHFLCSFINTYPIMKLSLLLLGILPLLLFSQSNMHYFQAGPAFNINKSSLIYGGAIGTGVITNKASMGIGIEMYSLDEALLAPIYLDVRCYFREKGTRPYVVLQPGYAFRDKTMYNTVESGGLFAASGLGVISNFSRLAVNFQVKYSIMAGKLSYTGPGGPVPLGKFTNNYIGFSALLFLMKLNDDKKERRLR